MAEPDTSSQAWSTWQELLLACAVHRHGTSAWDSVAAEILKRTTTATDTATVTSHHCEQKYLDLKKRYGCENNSSGTVPWLDQLRTTRVHELKLEVQRCDLSITSLQLKVKKLKEERESGENSDLEKKEVKIEKTDEPDRFMNESTGSDPEPEPERVEPVEDDSCNGSSDSVENKPVGVEQVTEPVGVEPVKESSDLQSWAGESDKVRVGCGNEDEDLAVEKGKDGSEPLGRVLEMIRGRWSIFAGRLMMQEAGDHKNSIRQHVDIETIHTRLEEGCYSDCKKKFFRDLLIFFNNATLFLEKKSPEFTAAVELRKLISREIYLIGKKSDVSTSLSSKLDPDPSDSLVLKPKIMRPIIVCRKRSSLASKVSGSSSGEEKKVVQDVALLEDKPLLDWKQTNKCFATGDEIENTKKRTSDRFISIYKSSKKNGKNQTSPNQNQVKGSSPKEHTEPKTNKNNPNMKGANKRNLTIVNKSKQKTSKLLESLKDSEISPNNGKGGAEIKKLSGSYGRGERKREQKERQVKERESPIKRNNGRVGKSGVAAPPPVVVSGKRGREGGDADVAASSQPKKRSRR